MALTIELKSNKFRVQGQEFVTTWMADTLANRKAIGVFLRNLRVDERPLYSAEELSVLFAGKVSQVNSCIQRFEDSGRDFVKLLHHESKAMQKWELEKQDNKFRFTSFMKIAFFYCQAKNKMVS